MNEEYEFNDALYLQECQVEKFELDSPIEFQYNYKTETENERQ